MQNKLLARPPLLSLIFYQHLPVALLACVCVREKSSGYTLGYVLNLPVIKRFPRAIQPHDIYSLRFDPKHDPNLNPSPNPKSKHNPNSKSAVAVKLICKSKMSRDKNSRVKILFGAKSGPLVNYQ